MKILITGAAGFIGMHTAQRLLNKGVEVVGIDNLNDYYDVNLKLARLDILKAYPNFSFYKSNIADTAEIGQLLHDIKPNVILHLAAQAGVRYSLTNPYVYIESNVLGFVNILEAIKEYKVEHFLYASSSSVYGGNTKLPFSELDSVDTPVSLYAATKKSNELIAHTYSHLYSIPTTGLRFFTVYGPWGRPDMALFKFAKAIKEDSPIEIYNQGNMLRDFTYVDDIVESICRLIPIPPKTMSNFGESGIQEKQVPYRILNIGNNNPVKLTEFIDAIEKKLDKKAKRIYMDMQPGDVVSTYADVTELERITGFRPATSIEKGINNFMQWYNEYYKTKG